MPKGIPAADTLKGEGIQVAHSSSQEALKVLVVNLMPLKEQTETQLCRMLSSSTSAVQVSFCVPDGSKNKNTAPEHIERFYCKFSEIKGNRYDGVIVTGAPVEHLPFEDVFYWPELQELFEWIKDTEAGMYSICWGAMASLYHFHGIPKHLTASKQFGVFPHRVLSRHPIVEGLPDGIGIPVSRHTEWRMDDMLELPDGVEVLVASDATGPCVIYDSNLRHLHMMNHFEYDVDTLDQEYRRDVSNGTPTGEPIPVPACYYPDDNPTIEPLHTWQSSGNTFYANWLSTLHRGGGGP